MTTFACHGIELQRRRLARVLVAVGLVTMGFMAYVGTNVFRDQVGSMSSSLPLSVMATLAIVLSVVIAFVSGVRRAGHVTLDDAGLLLGHGTRAHAQRISRGEVRSGYEVASIGGVRLELTGGRALVLELEDKDVAERVLEHVGQSVRLRALDAPLRGEFGALTKGLVTLLCSSVASLALFGWFFGPLHMAATLSVSLVASVACTAFALRHFGWPKVFVGIDGVRVAGGFRSRFVPYSDIGPAHVMLNEIQLALRDGTLLHLQTVGQSHDQIAVLARRIEQGRAACGTGESKDLGALGRDGRTIRQWSHDVRRAAVASGGFREHALTRDDFEQLLLDARAPTDQRIGAALALRAVDPLARSRIRVAATASANERLRVALEACATEAEDIDEAALEGALS